MNGSEVEPALISKQTEVLPSAVHRPPSAQLSLFELAPSPAITYLQRLNINELTPIEALNKLYELQRLAQAIEN